MRGSVSLPSGRVLDTPVFIYPISDSAENASVECAATASPPCMVTPNQEGYFEVGPIVPGSYVFEVDVDDDGFPEISSTYAFGPDEAIMAEFPSVVPSMSDISFSLEDSLHRKGFGNYTQAGEPIPIDRYRCFRQRFRDLLCRVIRRKLDFELHPW